MKWFKLVFGYEFEGNCNLWVFMRDIYLWYIQWLVLEEKKCLWILSVFFFFLVIIKYLSVFKWFLFLLYQDISIFFFHKRFFVLTDTKKQHMRGWIQLFADFRIVEVRWPYILWV